MTGRYWFEIRRFLALFYTQTSMTLQWQPPKKGGVKLYELYKNGQKVDTSKDIQMTVVGLDVGYYFEKYCINNSQFH